VDWGESDNIQTKSRVVLEGGFGDVAIHTWALFSSEKISDFGTVALSFVCDKYYPIMD
jgi:hypothetical protein